MEGAGFMTILQPATRGLLRCFGFTFWELSFHPSLYMLMMHTTCTLLLWLLSQPRQWQMATNCCCCWLRIRSFCAVICSERSWAGTLCGNIDIYFTTISDYVVSKQRRISIPEYGQSGMKKRFQSNVASHACKNIDVTEIIMSLCVTSRNLQLQQGVEADTLKYYFREFSAEFLTLIWLCLKVQASLQIFGILVMVINSSYFEDKWAQVAY